jgi:TolB-like protein/Tfp pilus assembly protein PilF
MASFHNCAIRIGAWKVNEALDEISKDQLTVKLEPRTMRLLICLAEHADQVVSIDQLLDQVWKDVVVSHASVYQAIAMLRRSLADDLQNPSYIVSVARRGYRLIAPVVREPAAGVGANLSIDETAPAVAVLPFADISDKGDQQYFADGLSIELINLLTKVDGLHVPAKTSSFYFRGKSEDIRTIARHLLVTHVLDGSVRTSGNHIRISVQLVRAESGYHVWSRTYERQFDDIFKIQDEIAAAVISALKVSILGSNKLSARHDTKGEPYILYLQARAMNQRRTGSDNATAIEYLQRALALDPDFAPAWAALSDVMLDNFLYFSDISYQEVRREAHAAAERALELDRSLADAHLALARFLCTIDWNFVAAEFEVNQALSLDPRNPQALRLASELASIRGRPDLALELASRAVANDPLDARGFTRMAAAQVGRRKFVEAIAALRKALELNPTAAAVHYWLASNLVASGDANAALIAAELEPDEAFRHASLALAFDALGRRADADRELNLLQRKHAGRSAYQVVEVLARRGDLDQAFEWLDRAYRQRDSGFIKLMSNPLLENLITDVRLRPILRKLKLHASIEDLS